VTSKSSGVSAMTVKVPSAAIVTALRPRHYGRNSLQPFFNDPEVFLRPHED
jgi:hypothetical protein